MEVKKNKSVSVSLVICIGIAVAFTVLRLALSDVLMVYYIPFTGYDDVMQLLKAISITDGVWLGAFSSTTLVKGVGYPLLTALFHSINIPYIFAYHLLYVLSCLVFILAIKPVTPNKWFALFAYAFLLFSPIAFSAQLTRLYRDIGYYSVALFSFSMTLGMMLRYKNTKNSIGFAICAGFSLSFAVSYREDSHWLLIYGVACSIVYIIAAFFHKREQHKRWKILTAPALFLVCFLAYQLTVSGINYHYYGYFIADDYNSGVYAKAYGALSRVNNSEEDPRIVIAEAQRMQLYELSPAFAELRDYLENDDSPFREWVWVQGEYRTGYFSFVLRDVVASAGYYTDASTANDYYERLADEVNQICDEGLIDAGPKRRGVVGRYYPWMLKPIAVSTFDAVLSVLACPGINPSPIPVEFSDKELAKIESWIHDEIAALRVYEDGHKEYNCIIESGWKLIAWHIIRIVLQIYRLLLPVGFIFSLLSVLAVGFSLIARKIKGYQNDWMPWIASASLLCLYILRCFMLAYVQVSAFPAIGTPSYEAASYPALIAFIIVAVFSAYKQIVIVAKKKNP
ncbi:MAG: hypothetical protein GX222_08595 [Ruminococcaceae bacterium]|nr:hypothetical protein [Oscillospiraceae bacterium]